MDGSLSLSSPPTSPNARTHGTLEMLELELHHDEDDHDHDHDDEDHDEDHDEDEQRKFLQRPTTTPTTRESKYGGIGKAGPFRPTLPTLSSTTSQRVRTRPMGDLKDVVLNYVRLMIQLYPRLFTIALAVAIVLVVGISVTVGIRHRAMTRNSTRHSLEGNYSTIGTTTGTSTSSTDHLTQEFAVLVQNIHHLCLFGTNDKCPLCDDPNVPASKSEYKEWSKLHNYNKQSLQYGYGIVQQKPPSPPMLDVVFLGDDVFQTWSTGKIMEKSFREGPEIAATFNQTFRSGSANDLSGLSLGIAGDMTTNLLWRINHGELPDNLQAKVFWIMVGSNDLALSMCSEDVVTIGILRVAEEIAHLRPNSKVVIQGLLPRSNHRDGSLHATASTTKLKKQHGSNNNGMVDDRSIWSQRISNIQSEDLDYGHSTTSSAIQQLQQQQQQQQQSQQNTQPNFDYYIWPSILAINNELKSFVEHHTTNDHHTGSSNHPQQQQHNHADKNQFFYFDADDLFVEDAPGSSNGKEKRIRRDYMPNSILLSTKGHTVLMNAIKKKLQQEILVMV